MQSEQSVGDAVKEDGLPVTERGGASAIVPLLRQWAPLVLTILLVPGGVLLGVALVVRHWNRRRAAALPMVGQGIARA